MDNYFEIVERRGKPRVESKVRVRIGGREGDIETFTGNLSKNGVFLETSEPFADLNDRVQLQILIANSSDAVKITGQVKRIQKPNQVGVTPGMAIHFLRIEARQARTFDRFIDRLLEAKGIGCRKYPRAKSQVVVEFRTKAQVKKFISDNLSHGGLFIKTPVDDFSIGSNFKLILLHPTSKRRFMVDVEVVHIRKGESRLQKDYVEGIGVQFINLSSSRRSDMASFLRSILAYQRRNA